MLVIGRQPGQGLYIGRIARATVLSLDARRVRISVDVRGDQLVAIDGHGLEEHLAAQARHEAAAHRLVRKITSPVRFGFLDGREPDPQSFELGFRDGLYIGRSVHLIVLGIQPADQIARIGIMAPGHVAVSRDDFTVEQHMRWQRRRETAAEEHA